MSRPRSHETVAPSGAIRRAQISFGALWASEGAFTVGLTVVAFRDGGVAAVGIVTAARMGAAALLDAVAGHGRRPGAP